MDSLHTENGFQFYLSPAKTAKAEALIVILHGHGDHPKNWKPHVAALQEKSPQADIILLQGPFYIPAGTPGIGLPEGQDGYSYMPNKTGGLQQAKLILSQIFNRLPFVSKVDAFVKAQLRKRDMTWDKVAFVGFSLGAITALQLGLNSKKTCAAVISHAGALPPFTKVRSRPPILFAMGDQDEIFRSPPPQLKGFKRIFNGIAKTLSLNYEDSIRRFNKREIPFQQVVEPGMAHKVSPGTLEAGARFIAAALTKTPAS